MDGLFDAPAGRTSGRRLPGGDLARLGAAGGADASAHARRAGRPVAAARARLAAAPADRGRAVAVAAAVGAARHRQDDDRLDRQPADRPSLRRGLRGLGRGQGGPGRDRQRPRRAGRHRQRDRAVRRRGAPLQQGPAGRAAARGREPLGHAGRRDHREPVLLRHLPAALAQPAAAPGVADRRRRAGGDRAGARRRARPGGRVHPHRGRRRAPGPAGRRRRAPLPDLPGGRRGRGPVARLPRRSTWPPPRPRSTRRRCATTGRATSTTT